MYKIKLFCKLFTLILCVICAHWSSAYANEKPNIVVTTGMIADAVSNIAEDHVNIKVLMGSGVDPHAYRQTRSDIVSLANADLVLWNGLYLEAQMEEFLIELGNERPVIAVAENVPHKLLIGSDEYVDDIFFKSKKFLILLSDFSKFSNLFPILVPMEKITLAISKY